MPPDWQVTDVGDSGPMSFDLKEKVHQDLDRSVRAVEDRESGTGSQGHTAASDTSEGRLGMSKGPSIPVAIQKRPARHPDASVFGEIDGGQGASSRGDDTIAYPNKPSVTVGAS
jgi:hypothetical protein